MYVRTIGRNCLCRLAMLVLLIRVSNLKAGFRCCWVACYNSGMRDILKTGSDNPHPLIGSQDETLFVYLFSLMCTCESVLSDCCLADSVLSLSQLAWHLIISLPCAHTQVHIRCRNTSPLLHSPHSHSHPPTRTHFLFFSFTYTLREFE